MKNLRRTIVLMLAVLMTLTFAVPVFAADNKATITITNATIGKQYTAYKIFDATIDGKGNIAYQYNGSVEWDNENGYFVMDAAGNITATDAAKDKDGYLTTGAVEFLATLKGTAAKSVKAEAETILMTDLEYGYYYIETNNGAAVMVDSTNPDAVVYDKNQKTDFDKKIIIGYEEDGTPILATFNTANVGEKVLYQITIDAANYNGKNYITNYYVYDKLDEALTFNDDIEVSVNGNKLAKNAFTVVSGKDAGDFAFKINIPWVDKDGKFLYNKTKSTIIVTYSATVNELVKTAAPMVNGATYYFNDLPTPPDRPNERILDPNPDIPYKTTMTYSTELKIAKVDAKGNALTKAKFKISGDSYSISLVNKKVFEEVGTQTGTHYMLKDGEFTKDDPILKDYTDEHGVLVKANIDRYDSAEKKYALVEKITKDTEKSSIVSEGWVDKDGFLSFTGLGEGDYLITELVAPDGFNLLQNPIAVKITFDEVTRKFKAQYKEINTAGELINAVVTDGTISFNVVNNAGTELPATGGKYTAVFMTLGTVLFLGMGVMLVAKKRLYNEG